jgi:hypothetical protein
MEWLVCMGQDQIRQEHESRTIKGDTSISGQAPSDIQVYTYGTVFYAGLTGCRRLYEFNKQPDTV